MNLDISKTPSVIRQLMMLSPVRICSQGVVDITLPRNSHWLIVTYDMTSGNCVIDR